MNRRDLFVGILVTLIFAVAFAAVADTWLGRDLEIRLLESRLSEVKGRRVGSDQMATLRTALSVSKDRNGTTLQDHGQATIARLEDIVRTTAHRHGADLVAMTSQGNHVVRGLAVVRISLHGRIDETEVGHFIAALENGRPQVFFHRVVLSRTAGKQVEDAPIPRIELIADVYAYREGEVPGGAR